MPRPRFQKLPDGRQKQIFEIAAKEFAANGFEGASLNRILEEAEVSKGAAYYYFDDKADRLGTAVLYFSRDIVDKFVADLKRSSADNFWSELSRMSSEIQKVYSEYPWFLNLGKEVWRLPKEVRTDGPLGEASALGRHFFETLLKHGQKIEAIRTDMPEDFLISVVLGIGEAGDSWIVEHWNEFENPHAEVVRNHQRTLEMLRKVLEPSLTLDAKK